MIIYRPSCRRKKKKKVFKSREKWLQNEFVKNHNVARTLGKYSSLIEKDNFCVKINAQNPLLKGVWTYKRLFANRFSIKEYLSSDENIAVKTEILKAYTHLKMRIRKETYEEHRNFKKAVRRNVICSVCEKEDAYCYHHIQLVKNGGLNKDYNLIPICYSCHKKVHDWLV